MGSKFSVQKETLNCGCIRAYDVWDLDYPPFEKEGNYRIIELCKQCKIKMDNK